MMAEMGIKYPAFLLVLFVIGSTLVPANCFAQDKTTATPHPAESITAQASDPTAPIIQFSLTDFFSPDVHNSEGFYNSLQFQPITPIPKLKHFPVKQILRLSLSFISINKDPFGINDVNLFHLFVPDLESWGSWSVGYTFTFPTGKTPVLGSGKWQIGPAASLVYYKIKNWQFGGVISNSFSFAGSSANSQVNTFTFQPIINRMFGKTYLGVGDFVWSHDWSSKGVWNIPLGLQLGRIARLGKYNYNLSIEVEYTAARDSEVIAPVWGLRAGIVLLIPENH
jgi:hypothetical protein